MSNIDVKTAGQIMRERFFEIKRNRKFSPEIKEILEKNKEEFLKNKIDIRACCHFDLGPWTRGRVK